MKSMQRRFGGLLKRSADQADVGAVLADFKAADEMLDRLIKDLIAWRNSWEDILKLQYDAAEALSTLYKPIEPTQDPEMRHQPTPTPERYLEKCLGLQKLYAETRGDLAQEIGMITTKLVRPAEEAKQATKSLQKTLKHRENTKLDYERYLGRAEHVRKKDNRSIKEEAALIKHENDLTQAQIDYQTADEQIKQTFPPVTDAIVGLMPYLMANQIMLQTTIVGQLYTVLDAYCRKQGLPSPAPQDAEIISTWDREFTGFRKELEQGLKLVSQGKAVQLSMTLSPEKDKTTVTGLGLRNKVLNRNKSDQGLPQHIIGSNVANGQGNIANHSSTTYEEEAPPVKPPRPGASPSHSSNYNINQNSAAISPQIPLESRPRMASNSSYSNSQPPYPTGPTPIDHATPGSSYYTPPVGTPTPFSSAANGGDYFNTMSNAAAAAAAKKKPPPPVPAKRIPSNPGPQYVSALYDFEGQNAGDLAFRQGDRIRVVRKTDQVDDWWEGELRGVRGSFPANYVQV